MSKRARRSSGRRVKKAKAKAKTARRGSAKRPRVKRTARHAKSKQRRQQSRSARSKSTHRSKNKKATAVKKQGRRQPVARATAPSARSSKPPERGRGMPARLERPRRILDDGIPTPPSSLDMERHGSAVRTGRAEMQESRLAHATMTPAITGGDVDASLETAYFSGDESPGGDNSTPDQDIVDHIGKALGVEYDDSEELRASDKVVERDKHRWELDPASSEDYRDRK